MDDIRADHERSISQFFNSLLVACFQGMRTQGGTRGVERAATSSVVLASLLIIVTDVVLVRLILVFFP